MAIFSKGPPSIADSARGCNTPLLAQSLVCCIHGLNPQPKVDTLSCGAVRARIVYSRRPPPVPLNSCVRLHIVRSFVPSMMLVLSAFCVSAFACKPVFSRHPVADFIGRRQPGDLIFTGTVASVSAVADAKGNLTQTIVFHPDRRWSGPSNGDIAVMGYITRVPENDCGGLGDFSATTGQRWLVFATTGNGMVWPVAGISVQIGTGKIAPATLRQLNQIRRMPH